MRVPSGEKAAERTRSSCPPSTAISAPLAASHSRAVLSHDAVTMRVPSGEKAADAHDRSSCPLQHGDLPPRRRLPQPGGTVA